MEYRIKYIRYKNKYLNLKNNLRGGAHNVKFIGSFNTPNNIFNGRIEYNGKSDEIQNMNGIWISDKTIESVIEGKNIKVLKY